MKDEGYSVEHCHAGLEASQKSHDAIMSDRTAHPINRQFWAGRVRYWNTQLEFAEKREGLERPPPEWINEAKPIFEKPKSKHKTRREFDELFCIVCKKRWDIKEEAPECTR